MNQKSAPNLVRMPPLPNLRIAKELRHQQFPAVELQPSKIAVPCDKCRARWARGELALATHPACGSHLLAGR